jgi:general secretion pathway protein J
MRPRCRAPASGFTLIEVLVGLAILGITSGLLMSAVYSLALGANSGVDRLDRMDSDRLFLSFLRREIESIRPAAIPADNRNEVVFNGTADRMQFVGHLPAHHGGGGLTVMSLSLDPSPIDGTLVLSTHDEWESFAGIPPDSDQGWAHRELARNVDELRFSYFGDPDAAGSRRWLAQWAASEKLPELIRVEMRSADRPGSSMVIAVRGTDARHQPQLIVRPSRVRA